MKVDWMPKTSIEQRFRRAVNWHKQYEKQGIIRETIEKQIDDLIYH